MRTLFQWAIALLVLVAGARAEVTMSLTINGSPEELVAIIQQLQALGFGTETESGSNPLKLRMLSVASGAPEPPPPPPALALGNAFVSPGELTPGTPMLLTVDALDDEHVIDTITARYMDRAADLFDNGMRGDAIAGDGIWTAQISLPEDAVPGDYLAQVTAYDAHGLPLTDPLDDSRMLTVETSFVVLKP